MTFLQFVALLISCFMLLAVVKNTQISALKSDTKMQHRFFGATALVFILWIFRTGITEGLVVHFMWLTSLSLVLGFRWALLSASIVLVAVTGLGYEKPSMLGINWLLGVAIPIAISYGIFSWSFHKLPKNVFVYLFVCAFFPGAISISLKMLMMSAYFAGDTDLTWNVIYQNYLLLTPLMLFPEAFFNGMTMTVLVVHKPQWVYTYHDKFYIDNK
ncbi:energy-coupling factor ABC transporter permease [Glaciecola sp. MH2013]|uniref:energy-coupling factor ABC transporter permease n=1 Tax=Glaciecola sp. MH2013 TaxID=2785524 RepID=UPI00189EDFD2|nr:energy-coupling factor ABC transporter permease [Glaciecola sp. MH2013]MBF7072958.1 energy-coupling factor ABC transporter permease [Glaciecola sp. MH2013]